MILTGCPLLTHNDNSNRDLQGSSIGMENALAWLFRLPADIDIVLFSKVERPLRHGTAGYYLAVCTLIPSCCWPNKTATFIISAPSFVSLHFGFFYSVRFVLVSFWFGLVSFRFFDFVWFPFLFRFGLVSFRFGLISLRQHFRDNFSLFGKSFS